MRISERKIFYYLKFLSQLMKLINIFIVILLFSACQSSRYEQLVDNDQNASNYTLGTKYTDSISPMNVSPKDIFGFRFILEDSNRLLHSIKVYENDTLLDDLLVDRSLGGGSLEVYLNDWNFDGYLDLTILDKCSPVGCTYWIFNYNPLLRKYEYNKYLSQALGLEIDTIAQLPFLHHINGPNEESWDTLTYLKEREGVTLLKGCYQKRWVDAEGNDWIKNYFYKVLADSVQYSEDSFIVNRNVIRN